MSKKSSVTPRICFLTETFYPPVVGGLEKHAYQLSEKLTSKGLELFVITRQTEPPSADSECVGSVSVRRISPRGQLKGRGWKALCPILLFLIRLVYLLLKNARQYDIIMMSGLKILPIPAVLASIVTRKKSVIRVESPVELREEISYQSLQTMNLSQSSILLKLVRTVRNMFASRADCLIAISSEIRRELIGIGVDPQKVRYIPNGIDTDKFCPVSRQEKLRMREGLSLPTDKTILIFTGRLAESKGVMILIKVWEELVRKYNDIHLLLVGSGKGSYDSCERELRDYIREHNLEWSVFITGEVDNVYEYLQASDVFVFPSEYEGFGLSIVEALACGLPTVTTRVGVAAEFIENHRNGILVNPNNEQEMRTSIEWLIEHKDLWDAMGANARKDVVGKYSIEVVSDKYIEMFIELQRRDGQLPSYSKQS